MIRIRDGKMKSILKSLRAVFSKRKTVQGQQSPTIGQSEISGDEQQQSIPLDRLSQAISQPQHQPTPDEPAPVFSIPTPMAPSDARIIKQIEKTKRECISFKRVYPPDHLLRTLTFQGSNPIAPENFEWPHYKQTTPNGQTQSTPMTFMAQVDCATLPPFQEHPLPKQGVLYFFVEWDHLNHNNNEPVVVYKTGNSKEWQTIEPPENIPACFANQAADVFSWIGHTENAEQHFPSTFPKWAMETGIISSYSSDNPYDFNSNERQRYYELLGKTQIQAMSEFHSPVLSKQLKAPSTNAGTHLWKPFADFPHNWLAIEMFSGYLLNEIWDQTQALKSQSQRPNYPFKEIRSASEQQTLFNQIAVECHGWRKKARHFGQWKTPDIQTQGEFWRWLEFHVGNKSLFDIIPSSGDKRPALIINSAMASAATHASEASLTHSSSQAALIPQDIIATLKSRHRCVTNYKNNLHSQSRHHRMFGYPQEIQSTSENYEEYISSHLMLMQLDWDPAIFWKFGDCGALQYWITPQDLENHRFENAKVTF